MMTDNMTDTGRALARFGFSPNQRVILVLGGSQGAEAINRHIAGRIEWYSTQKETGLLWQCGSRNLPKYAHYDSVENSVRVLGFIEGIADAYAACSAIVARAGALTISELAIVGKPSILIPLPTAAGNHQLYNARSYAATGAAAVIREHELSEGVLESELTDILQNKQRYETMARSAVKAARPDATRIIVNDIVKLAGWTLHVSEV